MRLDTEAMISVEDGFFFDPIQCGGNIIKAFSQRLRALPILFDGQSIFPEFTIKNRNVNIRDDPHRVL